MLWLRAGWQNDVRHAVDMPAEGHYLQLGVFVVGAAVFAGLIGSARLVRDLLAGDNDGTGSFTIPQRPIRRRLHGVERFVITRGGEYCFLPSLSALRWLANPRA